MEALTIKTFETSKISAAKVSENRSKDFKYKSVTFAYNGEEEPPIRVDEDYRVFKFENKNAPVYSLVINCTGDNESFFRKLNSVLTNQSCKILKDHTVTPENFALVKENKYGCFRKDLPQEIWESQVQDSGSLRQNPHFTISQISIAKYLSLHCSLNI